MTTKMSWCRGAAGLALLLTPMLTALPAAVSSPANAADTVVWNFSLWGPPRAVTAAADLLAETVAEKTAGNFTIRLHYGEAVSPAKENLDSIKMGAVEIAMICTAYHPGKNPAMTGLDLDRKRTHLTSSQYCAHRMSAYT